MLSKIFALTFAIFTIAEGIEVNVTDSEPVADEAVINTNLACKVFGGEDFTEFDLRPLEK